VFTLLCRIAIPILTGEFAAIAARSREAEHLLPQTSGAPAG
jgi:hypothetical protein